MTPFERWAVWISSGLTIATGIAYGIVRYLVRTDDPFAVVNHPIEPWLLRAHIIVAPALIYAIGVISVRHVWQHIRHDVRSGRATGWTMTLSVVPMILTGYLIQVVTRPDVLEGLVIVHLATGLLFAGAIVGHARVLIGRRRRREDPTGSERERSRPFRTRNGRVDRAPKRPAPPRPVREI